MARRGRSRVESKPGDVALKSSAVHDDANSLEDHYAPGGPILQSPGVKKGGKGPLSGTKGVAVIHGGKGKGRKPGY